MKKAKNLFFLLICIFSFFVILNKLNKVDAFSLKNEKSKQRSMSNLENLHKPSYNPGGNEFQNDQEFYEVYQKKYNSDDSYSNNDCSDNLNQTIPGAKLIDSIEIEKVDRKEMQEISSKKYFCVMNSDFPEELNFLVESECNQEVRPSEESIYSNSLNTKKIVNQISNSEMKIKKNIKDLERKSCENDEIVFENTSSSKSDLQNNDTYFEFEEEFNPSIKYKG